MARRKWTFEKTANENKKASTRLYTLGIYLLNGPIADEFDDTTISRTVQIRGDQTLEDLHHVIFKAFDREDEHLYEFNLGLGPEDRSAIYSLPTDTKNIMFEEMAGDVTTVTIDSLGLKVGRAFGYLFDFGDDWLHQINVIEIGDFNGSGKYPKIIDRVGESPPQYPDIEGD